MLEKRGRRPPMALGLAIIPGGGRPSPPDGMPEDQAKIWQEVVAAMPAFWFGKQNANLLQRYCHHCCSAEVTEQQMRRLLSAPLTEKNLRTLNRLSVIDRRTTAAMLAVATKLRLTPQSAKHRFSAEAEIRNAPKSRPWEDD